MANGSRGRGTHDGGGGTRYGRSVEEGPRGGVPRISLPRDFEVEKTILRLEEGRESIRKRYRVSKDQQFNLSVGELVSLIGDDLWLRFRLKDEWKSKFDFESVTEVDMNRFKQVWLKYSEKKVDLDDKEKEFLEKFLQLRATYLFREQMTKEKPIVIVF